MNVNYFADNKSHPVPPDFNIVLCKDSVDSCTDQDQAKYKRFKKFDGGASEYLDLNPGMWGAFLLTNESLPLEPLHINFTQTKHGGIFTWTIFTNPNSTGQAFVGDFMRQAPDNEVSIMWQVPQYFVISVAEILFSITGYEFAYSQAPLSMKSVVFALYLLTDAVGNVIILIISSVDQAGFDASWIFLIYACLMFFITIVFVFIAMRYKYTLYVREDEKPTK